MVNLRFHIVSLVAVFFALAIGIGMGSSVVRSGVLERTESQLKSLDATLNERNRDLTELREERELTERLDEAIDDRFLDSGLHGQKTVLVATPGVTTADVASVARVVRSGGGAIVGVVRPTVQLRLGPDVDPTTARIVARVGSDAKADDVAASLRGRLVEALSGGPDSSDALSLLAATGFIQVRDLAGEALDAWSLDLSPATRVVVVGLADADAATLRRTKDQDGDKGDAALDVQPFLVPFAASLGAARPGFATVVDPPSLAAPALQDNDFAERSAVRVVRSRSSARRAVSTVDGALGSSDISGRIRRVALIAAIADATAGRIGHYGTLSGSDSVAPGA